VARLDDLLAARDAGSAEPCLAQLRAPEAPAAAARRASTLAANGTIFLITLGSSTVQELRATDPTIRTFLATLPPRFGPSESKTFRGVDGRSLRVSVLRDRGRAG
jgi:hypothetical protein